MSIYQTRDAHFHLLLVQSLKSLKLSINNYTYIWTPAWRVENFRAVPKDRPRMPRIPYTVLLDSTHGSRMNKRLYTSRFHHKRILIREYYFLVEFDKLARGEQRRRV
jgi:hypothetical protein